MGLNEQIYAVSKPRTSKADVVDYYQHRYTGKGQKGWKQHLIHDLLGAKDITVGSVGETEYKRLVKNMSKRFDTQRRNNPEPRNAAEYKALGETLPPKPPSGGGLVGGTIWVKYSDECVERSIDPPMHLSYKSLLRMVQMEQKEIEQAMANAYQSDQPYDADIDFKGPNACHPPEFTFTPIEDED